MTSHADATLKCTINCEHIHLPKKTLDLAAHNGNTRAMDILVDRTDRPTPYPNTLDGLMQGQSLPLDGIVNSKPKGDEIIEDEGPQVFVKDGQVVANSRDVAEYFGKTHADVMRSVKSINTLQNCGVYFRSSTWKQKTRFGFRENPAFDMSKDGFSLLVMGFTGKKAMQFKLAYIQRFNEMEAI